MATNLSNLKNRAVTAGLALAMAGSMLAPVAAFAQVSSSTTDGDNTGTTEVTVSSTLDEDYTYTYTDPETGEEEELTNDDLLSFTVPTVIPFAAMSDGTLVGPNANEVQIENESTFAIHVTSAAVEAEDDWNLVADATSSTADNSISFSFGVDASDVDAYTASQSAVDLSTDADYNMTYADSDGGTLDIDSDGDIANITNDISSADKVATITWTVAAGAAAATE